MAAASVISIMPIDFCTRCRLRMPVADCSVDFGLSAALRRSAIVRVTQATRVAISAQGAAARSSPASPSPAASAQASTRPEDRPISV